MNNIDYQLLTTITKLSQKTLLKTLRTFLKKYYPSENIIYSSKFILCKGEDPIMLVAHLDTVFKTPPKEIYYDQKQKVMWSPQGLGADDRAGVFAIIKIIRDGYKPHICFTTDEEIGGVGAQLIIKKFPKHPFDIKYIIQLDRQGEKDCVFYDCDNDNFETFIRNYDFTTEWGSFSDINIICPEWKIAGVNLSVGYFNEHNKIETLHTNFLYSTIKKVKRMINESKKAPYFKYIPCLYSRQWYLTYPCYPLQAGPYICAKCNKGFSADDVFFVKSKDIKNQKKYYCLNCVGNDISWCENCGEPFEVNNSFEYLCLDCKNKEQIKE